VAILAIPLEHLDSDIHQFATLLHW